MTIQNEVMKWKDKINELKSRQAKISDIDNEIYRIKREIFEIYEITFKNFTSKRIVTDIEVNSDRLCFNIEGFAFIWRYGKNSSYIKELDSLFKILKHSKEIQNKLNKKDKKKLIREWRDTLKPIWNIEKKKVFLDLKNPKELFELESNFKENQNEKQTEKIIRLGYDGHSIFFSKDDREKYWRDYDLRIRSIDLDDLINIEIFYKDILKLIKKYENYQDKLKLKYDKALNILKEKYSSHIILGKLKQDEK